MPTAPSVVGQMAYWKSRSRRQAARSWWRDEGFFRGADDGGDDNNYALTLEGGTLTVAAPATPEIEVQGTGEGDRFR